MSAASPSQRARCGRASAHPDGMPSGIEVPVVVTRDMAGDAGIRHAGRVSVHARHLRRRLSAAGSGRSASIPASARPRNPTSATASCSTRGRPACRWRSTCPRSAATTRSTRWRGRRSARSACRCRTWRRRRSCSTASTSARSRPRSRSTARPRSSMRCTWPCADKQGVPRAKLTGTIQNDILKEYVARGTWIFPVRPSMRLIADSILYSNEVTPRFNPISHRRRARARRGLHGGRGDGLHARQRPGLRRRAAPPRRRRRRSSPSACRSSSTCTWISSRRSRKFRAGAPALGAAAEGALRRDRREGADVPLRRRLRRLVAGGARSRYNNIVRVGDRDAWRRCSAARSRSSPAPTTRPSRSRPSPPPSSRCARSRSSPTRAASRARVDPLGGSYYVEWLTDRMEAGDRAR